MSIAATVQTCLSQAGVQYDIIEHTRTSNSTHTAQAAHVPGERIAKSVLIEDGDRYLMAVIPATHRVDIGALYRRLGREIGLATEEQVARLFADCDPVRCRRSARLMASRPSSMRHLSMPKMCISRVAITAHSCTSTAAIFSS